MTEHNSRAGQAPFRILAWCSGLGCAAWLLSTSTPARSTTAHDYRQMAEASVVKGEYEQAATCYRAEAAIYRRLGDLNAAQVEEMKADRWSTTIAAFADRYPSRKALLSLYTGAKFEPVYGCYLGGYIEADDRLDGATDPNGHHMMHEDAFNDLIQKDAATYFQYCHYGTENFPNWARQLSRHGMAPQIALEPDDGLDKVQDNAYLERFARDAAACKGPVFLRFAAEMNGAWTNYHDNPALYRQKFRLVHDVMAKLAPNVAMIWCPNAVPQQNIDQYYPGDDAVDWVGVNFYSVLHHDNNPKAPAWFEHPTSMLDYIYHRYAARKPIAICEYGSSHREALDPGVDRSDIGAAKIRELFAALPRDYPRVKLIDIFDCNNLAHARAGRQLNDYSVTDTPVMLDAFRAAVAPDYYLSGVYTRVQQDLPSNIQALTDGEVIQGKVTLSCSVQTYEASPTVAYSVDGKEIGQRTGPGDHAIILDPALWASGQHTITICVLDSNGKRAGFKNIRVMLEPPGIALAFLSSPEANTPRKATPATRLRRLASMERPGQL